MIMKKVLITLLFGISTFLTAAAQEINIGVVVPQDKEIGFNNDFYKLLDSRLKSLLTKSGFTSNYTGDFYLVPQVDILHEDKLETGLRTMDKIQMDITANVIQGTTNDVFNTYTWSISGSGFTRTEAAKNAIKSLNSNSKEFKEFVAETKQKVNDYYVKNKAALIARANTLASTQKFDAALALLFGYPPNVDGYADVEKAMVSIYKKYQTQHCAQMLQQAKAAAAEQHYSIALDIIAGIDASSSCASDANKLISQIQANVSDDKEYERKLEEKAIDAYTELKKEEYRSMAAIVAAYYESQKDNKDIYIVH